MVVQIKYSEHPGVERELEDFTVSVPVFGEVKKSPTDEVQQFCGQKLVKDNTAAGR